MISPILIDGKTGLDHMKPTILTKKTPVSYSVLLNSSTDVPNNQEDESRIGT
jgi:hypothetical protein